MVKEYTLESACSLWAEFFGKYALGPVIREVANSYPDKRSVLISYKTLILFDPNLAEFLLERPAQAIYSAEEAVRLALPAHLVAPIRVRFTDLPTDLKRVAPRIRDIRAAHLGALLRVRGVIRKRTEVRPMIKEAVFQCARCGCAIELPQDSAILKEPLECYEDQGGCKRSSASTKFLLLMGYASMRDPFDDPKEGATLRFSETVDVQIVELAEETETLKGGEQPERLSVRLQSDLVGKLLPGEHVVINGILRESPRSQGGAKSTIFELFLDALSLERDSEEEGETAFEPQEIETFRQFARRPTVIAELTASVAPSIYGLEREKLGLMLQLFGGVAKSLPDGTRIRGDIHIVMVGEPGTAKSQLLRWTASAAPRAIYTSGKSASSAGLTAAAVKDGDVWVLEAGAMVLADGGILCVDELGNMRETDQDALHEGMEQQTISVAKAGITATLQARTSILGAANPEFGRFDPHQSIFEQIDIPPPLLSRFDLIFTIADKPDRERDNELAMHVLDIHSRETPNSQQTSPTTLPIEFLKRYVRYAKETCKPILTREARDEIHRTYVDIRKQGEGDSKAVPITARQLEAYIRLSEAAAKARLSPTVTLEDAKLAIGLVEYYLRKIAGEGGVLDIDMITVGVTRAQREVARVLLELIRKLDQGSGVSEDDIIATATAEGLDERKARDMLIRLRESGDLYQPDSRHYRATSGFR